MCSLCGLRGLGEQYFAHVVTTTMIDSAVDDRAMGGDKIGEQKAVELLCTLCVEEHRTDPIQAAEVQAFDTVYRLLHKYPRLWHQFQKVCHLQAARDEGGRPKGPVGRICAIATKWGWKWSDPSTFATDQGITASLADAPKNWWEG